MTTIVQIDAATTVPELARVLQSRGLRIDHMSWSAEPDAGWLVLLGDTRRLPRRYFEAKAEDPVAAINTALRAWAKEPIR